MVVGFGSEEEAARVLGVKIVGDASGVVEELGEATDAAKRLADETDKTGKIAIKSYKEYQQAVDQVEKELKELMKQNQLSVDEAGRVFRSLSTSQKYPTSIITAGIKQTQQSLTAAQSPVQQLMSKFSGLGNIAQYVFGVVLGIGAVQAIQKLIAVFREAINQSLEFQKSMFTFEVAIRGLQRVGLDTTIEGWIENLDDLKRRFPIFSKKEFVDAAALAALMTREFGFTEQQMQNVVNQSIVLAQVTGKDLLESVRGVTYAIGSGYFESLQRAGINISRQIIAEEALRRGYEGSYTALSQTTRAMITYEIIQNNLNAIQEDAEKIMETTAGQVQRVNAAYQDLLITLGMIITETDGAKESARGMALLLETLAELAEFVSSDTEATPGGIWGILFGPTFGTFIKNLPKANEGLQQLNDLLSRINDERERSLTLGNVDPSEIPDESFTFAGEEVSKEQYEKLTEVVEKANEKILEIEKDAGEKRLDIQEDFFHDLQENAEDHYQRLQDIATQYEQRIADIGLKETRERADEESEYQFRVAEAARQFAFRRAEAERRYREREINAEKRFQEKMRQLRENFLLNLEDAVRERDALQIIRLTRQYNLRRQQMEREEGISGEERARAFQEELRQLEFQRQERLRQLAIEHERRLADIALQAEREREQAKVEYERRKADEIARFEEEQNKRKEQFQQEMDELDENIQTRINKVIDGLREEKDLSRKELQLIGDLYMSTYGPGSAMDVAVGYALQRLQQLQWMWFNTRMMLGGTTPAEQYAERHAEGGTVIATKPTTVTFGDAGAEVATFTPLNRSGVNVGRVRGNIPAGMGLGQQGGRYAVSIALSPGLEGQIIDNALSEVSDVIFSIERARY